MRWQPIEISLYKRNGLLRIIRAEGDWGGSPLKQLIVRLLHHHLEKKRRAFDVAAH